MDTTKYTGQRSAPEGTVNIAIVGAGAAGLFMARNIEQSANVPVHIDLFEKSGSIGGNTSSATYTDPATGYSTNIDCGAQFFFANPQPYYCQLLSGLGLLDDVTHYPAGITVWDHDQNQRTLFIPSLLKSFIDGTFKASDLPALIEFGLFFLAAEALDKTGDYTQSINTWLNSLWYLSADFKKNVLTPFMYQFTSLPLSRMGDASALYTLSYFVRNATGWPGFSPVSPDTGDTFTIYQSTIGLDGFLAIIAGKLQSTKIYTGTPVTQVSLDSASGLPTVTANGFTTQYDAVIIASDPQTAATLLAGGTAQPNAVPLLKQVEYHPLHIMVDSNTSLMPSDPASWQAANTIVSESSQGVVFAAYFGALRPLDNGKPIQVFKRWGNPDVPSPPTPPAPLADHYHFVLYPTVASIQARDALAPLQGTNSVWFAGGWTNWFDSQEAAYRSTLPIVTGLRPIIDPSGINAAVPRLVERPDSPRPHTVHDWLRKIAQRLPEDAQKQFKDAIAKHFEAL